VFFLITINAIIHVYLLTSNLVGRHHIVALKSSTKQLAFPLSVHSLGAPHALPIGSLLHENTTTKEKKVILPQKQ